MLRSLVTMTPRLRPELAGWIGTFAILTDVRGEVFLNLDEMWRASVLSSFI